MKKVKLLILLLSISLCGYAQEEAKRFAVSPETAKAGDEITITYDPAGSVLEGAHDVSGIMYTNGSFRWKAEDITLKAAGSKWQTKVKLATDAALITCVFISGELTDKGGRDTYSFMLAQSPGAYLSWGILRNPSFAGQVPNVVDEKAAINDTVSLMWVNYEMKYHPQSRKHIFYEGLRLMKSAKPGDPAKRIKSELRFILADKLDHQHQYKVQQALNLLEQPAGKVFTDSVKKVLLAQYPAGVLARDEEIKKMFSEPDLDKKIKLYNAFEKNFPAEKFQDVVTDTENLYLDKTVKSIAYNAIAKNKDYSFVLNNIKKVSQGILLDYGWHLISIPFNRDQDGIEKTPLETLKKTADIIIPELESREAFVPKEYADKLSLKQWQAQSVHYASREYLTYAKLLEIFKNYDLEKKYLDKIKPVFGFNDTGFNEVYARFLVREAKTAEAKEFLGAAIKANKATPEMLASLKAIFMEEGGKETGFDAYLGSLKSESGALEHKNKLVSQLINLPIEDFNLESSKGGMVKLSGSKGKIVVLDFWATWCGPCKNAMPGMQMAVSKYKEDPEVVFYFVDTQEFAKDYKAKTQAFIKEKGFDFTILYDGKNQKTGKLDETFSRYAKTFQFSGIPQKMIIDQNGKLRWQSTGYFGSPTELADEIAIVVDYLKAEKK